MSKQLLAFKLDTKGIHSPDTVNPLLTQPSAPTHIHRGKMLPQRFVDCTLQKCTFSPTFNCACQPFLG